MLNNFAAFSQRRNYQSIQCAAVVFSNNGILGNVHQTTSQITGVGCLEGGIRKTFTGTVCRDKILQNR